MAESQRESLIRSVDRNLAADPEFGNPQPILQIVEVRYHFGLELFAAHLPAAAELLRAVPGWPAGMRKELFFDPLVQLIYLWDVKRSSHPLVQRLMKNFDAYFMEGTDAQATLCTPDTEMVHALDQALSVFADMLPHTATTVLSHTHSIALAVMRLGGARLLTGSAGDGLPGVILLSPEELRNPWDTAGHLLHEGLHTRFADISRFSALVARNADVDFPWREQENDFTVARALSAFHVYVHFEQRRPPSWAPSGSVSAPRGWSQLRPRSALYRRARSRQCRANSRRTPGCGPGRSTSPSGRASRFHWGSTCQARSQR